MKVVNDFEAAVRAHEMKGASHPGDHEAIELNYELTKRKLLDALRKAKENKK